MVPDVKTCVTCRHDVIDGHTPPICKICKGWDLWEALPPRTKPAREFTDISMGRIEDGVLIKRYPTESAPVAVADDAGGAVKADTGKAPMSLLPRSALVAEAEVLAFGARKYAAHNWRKGMKWSRLLDAALRHLTAFADGEDTDPETGLSHLAHLRCCAGFLIEYQEKGLGEDDRHKEAA
jgi:hypothetical protein